MGQRSDQTGKRDSETATPVPTGLLRNKPLWQKHCADYIFESVG